MSFFQSFPKFLGQKLTICKFKILFFKIYNFYNNQKSNISKLKMFGKKINPIKEKKNTYISSLVGRHKFPRVDISDPNE